MMMNAFVFIKAFVAFHILKTLYDYYIPFCYLHVEELSSVSIVLGCVSTTDVRGCFLGRGHEVSVKCRDV